MKIDHLALWVDDLELMKAFYSKYFELTAGEKYLNPAKQFESYFLRFKENGACIELMRKPGVSGNVHERGLQQGLTHFAFSVGRKERVDDLTDQLRRDGFTICGEPRTTGDGYYESVILDPEGNQIEITI